MPRKGSMPSFSIFIVKLTEGWAWFRVVRKSVAVVMLGNIVRVLSKYLRSLFSHLDYPHHLINSTINTFVNSRVADHDQQLLQALQKFAGNDMT